MAIQSISLTGGQWVDVYAATNPAIAAGTRLSIQNFQSITPISLSDSATEPTTTTGRVKLKDGEFYQNTSGDLGLWAYSSVNATLSIQEV